MHVRFKRIAKLRKLTYFSQNIAWNQADPRGCHAALLVEQVA